MSAALESEDSARRRGSGAGESVWRKHWERNCKVSGFHSIAIQIDFQISDVLSVSWLLMILGFLVVCREDF